MNNLSFMWHNTGSQKQKRSENKMDINLSKAQYSEMYKEASKGTKWWVTIPKAFLFGGLICVIGQSLMGIYI